MINEFNEGVNVDIMCHDPNEEDDCYLYFAEEVPSFSFRTFKLSESALSRRIIPEDIEKKSSYNIKNQVMLTLDTDLKTFEYKICPDLNLADFKNFLAAPRCLEDTFSLDYQYYESNTQKGGGREPSGAYLFDPKDGKKRPYSSVTDGRIYQGKHLTIVDRKSVV